MSEDIIKGFAKPHARSRAHKQLRNEYIRRNSCELYAFRKEIESKAYLSNIKNFPGHESFVTLQKDDNRMPYVQFQSTIDNHFSAYILEKRHRVKCGHMLSKEPFAASLKGHRMKTPFTRFIVEERGV